MGREGLLNQADVGPRGRGVLGDGLGALGHGMLPFLLERTSLPASMAILSKMSERPCRCRWSKTRSSSFGHLLFHFEVTYFVSAAALGGMPPPGPKAFFLDESSAPRYQKDFGNSDRLGDLNESCFILFFN
jgi:hypothetical protein